jgi:parallel beta helix pectate lyase-like protein
MLPHSFGIAEDCSRRRFMISTAAIIAGAGGVIGNVQSQTLRSVSVTDFAADPKGVKNSTTAFQAAAAAINAAGGGTLVIPPGIYIVGEQQFAGASGKGYAYKAEPILSITGCTKPVIIEGNGAIMKAANGLKFGSFDPVTGAVYNPARMPFTDGNYLANAYIGMIQLSNNTGGVTVRNLELDGNIANIALGGTWGDTGRQCGAIGLNAYGNASLVVENVYTHHHAKDGIIIGYRGLTAGSPKYPHTLTNVVSEYNARQGLSWVGGTNLTATRCKFNHTGKAVFHSAPGAGVDIEAESSVCRNGVFIDCEFTNNYGAGLVADSGDSADVTFRGCTFWGVTNWSIWPRKPGFSFHDCKIIGACVNPYPSAEATKATRFFNCLFTDELLYGGAVHRKGNASPLIDMPFAENVLFESCRVVAQYQKVANIKRARIRNCVFEQKTGTELLPDKDWSLILWGCHLDSNRFIDSIARPPANAYYISLPGGTIVTGKNEVISPKGKWKWGHWSKGITGKIPETTN